MESRLINVNLVLGIVQAVRIPSTVPPVKLDTMLSQRPTCVPAVQIVLDQAVQAVISPRAILVPPIGSLTSTLQLVTYLLSLSYVWLLYKLPEHSQLRYLHKWTSLQHMQTRFRVQPFFK